MGVTIFSAVFRLVEFIGASFVGRSRRRRIFMSICRMRMEGIITLSDDGRYIVYYYIPYGAVNVSN
jgi:hypothetical protein